MVHEDQSPPPEYDGDTSQQSWGAKRSLQRSLKAEPLDEGEAAPLLANSSGDDGEGRRDEEEPEWEGMADFQNLPWWRTPSVSIDLSCFHLRLLMVIDILASTLILPIRPRIWWNHSSKDKSDTRIDMLGILFRVIKDGSICETTADTVWGRW